MATPTGKNSGGCSSDLGLHCSRCLTFALAAGGSRLAVLPDELFGPGPALAPQWSLDGKGAGLLVSALQLLQGWAMTFRSFANLACELVVPSHRKEVEVLNLNLPGKRKTGLGVVKMTKVVIVGRAAVEGCKA